jgi:hypothetical protein
MICGVIWQLTGLLLFRCNDMRSDDVTKDLFEWGPETNNREGDGTILLLEMSQLRD